MGSSHAAGLTQARLAQGRKVPALTSALQAGANCIRKGMPGVSFTSDWYRPRRLMSQSERLPS